VFGEWHLVTGEDLGDFGWDCDESPSDMNGSGKITVDKMDLCLQWQMGE